jgi:hypothetical protein
MHILIEENPNCEFVDGTVFQERTPPRPVTHVRRRRDNVEAWRSIVGLNPQMKECPALARKVDDSGDGTCYLVYGGDWGLRLKDMDSPDPWSLNNPAQWGEPFLLLSADGADLRFAVSQSKL